VIDPKINPAQMEMYADVESRGGILEPAGIVEVKFREPDQVKLMHRLDEQLTSLDQQLEAALSSEVEVGELEASIKAREEALKPLYTQIACEFADLHDRTGRMEAKGVIRKGLEWKNSRAFFYSRVKRRLLEQDLVNQLCAAVPDMTAGEAAAKVQSWLPSDDDKECVAFLEKNPLEDEVKKVAIDAKKEQLKQLEAEISTLGAAATAS